ncbi:MAG: hypothetical protein K8R02_00835 [Anaerohalosphaeraceae bacterium]|nr:hypothetical protein [Anaerohalosphaeraceae bacterium]
MSSRELYQNKRGIFSLRKLYYLISILVVLYPVVWFSCFKLDLLDIYWKVDPMVSKIGQSTNTICYSISNKSFFKAQPLNFDFKVNVPRDKIRETYNDDYAELLKDPNNVLVIGLSKDKKASLNIVKDGNSTKAKLTVGKGLGRWDDALVRLYWIDGRDVIFTDRLLSSGEEGSINYKVYPEKSARWLWAIFHVQLIFFIGFLIIAIFVTILIRTLGNTRKKLLNTREVLKRARKELAHSKHKLVEFKQIKERFIDAKKAHDDIFILMKNLTKLLLGQSAQNNVGKPGQLDPSAFQNYYLKMPNENETTPEKTIGARSVNEEVKTVQNTNRKKAESQILDIRQEEPRDKYIRFVCSCGKSLKALAEHNGKIGKCPRCEKPVEVLEKS